LDTLGGIECSWEAQSTKAEVKGMWKIGRGCRLLKRHLSGKATQGTV
jgi:hypothetical protein